MGLENIDSYEELKRLDELIESATELAALKPIYFRLNEIIQALPGDFDVQFTGNEVKQRLMARGTVLKQQGLAQAPPPAAPPPPAMPETQPPPPPSPFVDVDRPALAIPPEPVVPPAPFVPPEPFVPPAPVAAPELPVVSVPPVLPFAPVEPPAAPVSVAPPEPPVQPEPVVAPAPPAPHGPPEMFIAEQSPSFAVFPLFAGAAPPPEPPAPPAYFADTVGPAPVSPYERTVMGSATPSPLMYHLHDAATPEPPPLPLDVMAEPVAEELGPPPPAMPLAPPPPPPFPLPSPLFDFAPPEQHPTGIFATPEKPPPPPAPPAVQPPPPPPFPLTVPPAASPAPPLVAAPPLPSPLFDPAPASPPPPTVAATPVKPPEPPLRPPALPRRPFNWKRPVVIAPIVGLLVAALVVVLVVMQTRARNAAIAARARAAVQVDITTTPSGASVKVVADKPAAGGGNEAACTSNCKLSLAPGTYQISASLDGFEPAAGAVTVKALKPVSISLTLQPQALSVRLLTDLLQGKVVVDGQPPVDLQEGQLVLDKVASGTHTMKVTGPNGDASFSFEVADARLPAITGPVNARNMVAILVASFGKQAHLVTNAGPWKLAVNGQSQSDAGPAGTDLTSFQPGVNEIVLGDGKDQRNMSETFGAAPTLTAFLKTDINAGTLIVATGQDGVHVFVNGKDNPRTTQHGQLRVQILGKVTVRVAKTGFQDEPLQTADVKKGAEVRLQFSLKPKPQFGSLQIHGAMAGTEVLVDHKPVGTVGPDGLFNIGEIQPGEHNIELRREQHLPKSVPRSFQAGQAVVLTGADVVLATANGTIRLARPASSTITYRRNDEAESHEARGSQIELPAGSYVFSATAPGFAESNTRVQLAAGETRDVAFTLTRERPAAPTVVANAMSLFADAQSWTKDGDSWVHKGGGFVPFKPAPKGVLTFNVELVKGGGVFRAGAIRWCLQYIDPKNYLLFEIDRKNFRAWVIKEGQRLERVPKTPHNLGNQKSFTIQIDVTPDRLLQQVRGGQEWKVLDTFAEPGRDFTQGKFGFLIQGNDEIAISDFKFLPR